MSSIRYTSRRACTTLIRPRYLATRAPRRPSSSRQPRKGPQTPSPTAFTRPGRSLHSLLDVHVSQGFVRVGCVERDRGRFWTPCLVTARRLDWCPSSRDRLYILRHVDLTSTWNISRSASNAIWLPAEEIAGRGMAEEVVRDEWNVLTLLQQ